VGVLMDHVLWVLAWIMVCGCAHKKRVLMDHALWVCTHERCVHQGALSRCCLGNLRIPSLERVAGPRLLSWLLSRKSLSRGL
jgi:hypothetical protein